MDELIEVSSPPKGLDSTSTEDIIIEKDIVDNKKRCYCIDCSKFTENEVASYDSNDHLVVHHNNGHKHNGIFATDIERLLELGTSIVWLYPDLFCTVDSKTTVPELVIA